MKNILLIWFVFLSIGSFAQETPDSLPPAPRVVHHLPARHIDTLQAVLPDFSDSLPHLAHSPAVSDTFFYSTHPYFRFTDPVQHITTEVKWEGKDSIFYAIVLLLILFALLKNGFSRYLEDLYRIFFRTSIHQKQLKDQLMQSPLPSLLFNAFFVLSAGLFLALLLQHYNLGTQFDFWILFLYCAAGVIVVYGVKYLSLKVLGWVFQLGEAMNTYIFVVFTTNKVIGMALLPLMILLAFTNGTLNEAALVLSFITLGGLFLYRYFLSYISIHRQVSISFFHFVLYLCAFEIAPLLLINKLLFKFLTETS